MLRPRPRRSTTRGVRAAALALAAATALSGCGFGVTGLAFSRDDRVTILSPEEQELVRLPLTVDWEAEDFLVVSPGSRPAAEGEGYYAVFVDRAPVPPGKTLRHVAEKDPTCREADGCPDEEYLLARGVYTTTASQIVLETLPQTAREGRREFHTVTVVLLDAEGRRIGESAWEVRFELDRKALS